MTPWLDDGDFKLYLGDSLDVLQGLPDASVDCALTSPPFYALRDYGVDGQIGLEATPELWVERLVAVFREVRRVLKDSGTLWVECGDSYSSGGLGPGGSEKQATNVGANLPTAKKAPPGYKPKDLLGQPWMLAFALRADGWYLRQAIVWHKPNAMPESATDRCTTAHSYVFLLSKKPRYWFDSEAISEPAEWARWGDQTVPKYEGTETASGWMQPKTKAELRSGRVGRYQERAMYGVGDGTTPRKVLDEPKASKNPRSVWTIPTAGFSEAHFATWPEALVERILKAGCPESVCPECGSPWERVTVDDHDSQGRTTNGRKGRSNERRGFDVRRVKTSQTVGWRPTCDCALRCPVADASKGTCVGCRYCEARREIAEKPVPGVCLDPFMGSGTTALVARRLGRKSIGIELNEEYAAMCARRLSQLSLLADSGEAA